MVVLWSLLAIVLSLLLVVGLHEAGHAGVVRFLNVKDYTNLYWFWQAFTPLAGGKAVVNEPGNCGPSVVMFSC